MTPEERAEASDMELPKQMTCRHCAYFMRCVRLFNCKPNNTECDWSPSRFTEKRK